jgi:hypothetical protein
MLDHLLALHVTPVEAQDRAQINRLAEAVQAIIAILERGLPKLSANSSLLTYKNDVL